MSGWMLRRAATLLAGTLLLTGCLSSVTSTSSCACQRAPADVPYEIYVLTDPAQGPLSVVEIRGPRSGNPGLVALEALMSWRPSRPRAGANGFRLLSDDAITTVRRVSHRDGVITVDLGRSVWDPYPAIDVSFRIEGEAVMQQLVWTVQRAIGTTDPVFLTVRGTPARGIYLHRLNGPVGRDRNMIGTSGKIGP